MTFDFNTKSLKRKIRTRHAQIKIGTRYFLSSFYDKEGAWVEVLAKSTKKNGAGWPSSVSIKVLEPVGEPRAAGFYAPGSLHTVNATNLYKQIEHASAAYKYGRKV